MKPSKAVLIAIGAIVGFVYLIVANAAPAYLPPFTPQIFWLGIVVPLILATIIIGYLQNRSEKKHDGTSTTQKSNQSSKKLKTAKYSKGNHIQKQSSPLQLSKGTRNGNHVIPLNTSKHITLEEGYPTEKHPALICFAIDVSDTMIDSVIDHTGNTVKRWANIQTVLDRFIYLGAAFVKDPVTRKVLPLYNLIAYGFGFTERAFSFGINKKPGGAVRDLLAHPSFRSLPSVAELTDHWSEYKDHIISRQYSLDLLGDTPLCRALTLVRDRIKDELTDKEFTFPVLLMILSDGKPTDGDPIPIISELHSIGVLTLCGYLSDQDVLTAKQLYKVEDQQWPDGAKLMFHMASVLNADSYLSRAMFDYLSDTGWNLFEGVRLFAQINHSEALDSFLKVLLSGFMHERGAENHAK